MQQSLFESLPPPSLPDRSTALPAAQRWWRLQGDARRAGRRVEPLLVTPRFLNRIHSGVCPVTRTLLGPRSAVVMPLRDDATVAAGHLATLSPLAATAAAHRGHWTAAWAMADGLADRPGSAEHGLDGPAWRRLAVLRSFVQPLTPAQAASLPLLVLPPNRLRVLSPVQGLQIAITLALQEQDRAARLLKLAALGADEDTRLALRVFVLTLLARCPAPVGGLDGPAGRQALEDLWLDPLLQRRWQRLASRLTDADAQALLTRARRQRLLGTGWRPMDAGCAVDGWDLPLLPAAPPAAPAAIESTHVRRSQAAPAPDPATHRLAVAVLGPGHRRHRVDADSATAGGH